VQLIIDFTENNYIYSVYIHSTVSYTHPSFIFLCSFNVNVKSLPDMVKYSVWMRDARRQRPLVIINGNLFIHATWCSDA